MPTATSRWERFEERYNADLANALGNLASRTIAMVERYCGGVVPGGRRAHRDLDAADARRRGVPRGDGRARGYLLARGAAGTSGARWVAATSTWTARRRGSWRRTRRCAPQLDATLAALVRQLARHAVHLQPFMPAKAAELWRQTRRPGRARAAAVRQRDDAGREWAGASQKARRCFPRKSLLPRRRNAYRRASEIEHAMRTNQLLLLARAAHVDAWGQL